MHTSLINRLALTSLIVTASVLNFNNNAHALAKVKEGHYGGHLGMWAPNHNGKNFNSYGRDVKVIIERRGVNGSWTGSMTILNTKPDPVTRKYESVFDRNLEPITFSKTFDPILDEHGPRLNKMEMDVPSLRAHFNMWKEGFLIDTECFKGSSTDLLYNAKICMKSDHILNFDITERRRARKNTEKNGDAILHLVAMPLRNLKNEGIQAPITIEQAIQIGLERNPNAIVEIMKQRKAKLEKDVAALKLLPRMNIQTAVSLISATPTGIVQAIPVIAPFLSVTAWDKASEARRNLEASKIALTIAKASLANSIELEVYSYRKDVAILTEYTKLLEKIKTAKAKVEIIKKEANSIGSDINQFIDADVITDLDKASAFMQSKVNTVINANPIDSDRETLAHLTGISDVEYLRNIKIGLELPIENATKLDKDREAHWAKRKSLRYMDARLSELNIELARARRAQHPWELLDIGGNSSDGWGAATSKEFKIDDSNVEIKKVESISTEGHGDLIVQNAALDYNAAITDNLNSQEGRTNLLNKLTQLLDIIMKLDVKNAQSGAVKFNKESGDDIAGVVTSYICSIDTTEGNRFAYRSARAILDLAQMKGFYKQFRDEDDRPADDGSVQLATSSDDEINDQFEVGSLKEDQSCPLGFCNSLN